MLIFEIHRRGKGSAPYWKYGLSYPSSSTERYSVASLAAEAPSIGFAAAFPGLGSLSPSESSGSSGAREINRFGASICCSMSERED